jgi:hypothetical protein
MRSDSQQHNYRAISEFLAAAGVVSWLAAAAAAQQVLENQRATVEVHTAPARVMPGERVTISGFTDIDAQTPTISIAVRNTLTQDIATISIIADGEGNFGTVYEKTQNSGTYEVVAHSPSGRSSGKTFFIVALPAAVVGDIGGEVQNDAAETQRLLDQVTQMASALPDSPPQREFQQRIAMLRARVSDFRQALPVATDAFDKLKEMLERAPATAKPLDGYIQGLRDWDEKSQQQRARETKLTHANTICEQLERINEGLNLISLLFDLVGTPLQIVNNILFDKYATDALSSIAKVENENAKFAISQFLKVGVLTGTREGTKIGSEGGRFRLKQTVDLQGAIIGAIGDVIQFAVQKVFGASCERFVGTFTASLNAEFYKGLDPWWRYSEDLAGVLDLRYPKNSPPGQPIAMTGEFLGVATHYSIWEDAIRMLKLNQGAVTFHVRRPPIGTPFHPAAVKLGKAAFNQLPKAFHVPVTGNYYNNKIAIHLQTSGRDLNEAAKVTYVFLSPLTLLLPAITTAEFPYKDAHFVLEHSTDNGIIELPVASSDGKLFVASAAPKRTSGDGTRAHGQYVMNIKVCNPGCP